MTTHISELQNSLYNEKIYSNENRKLVFFIEKTGKIFYKFMIF